MCVGYNTAVLLTPSIATQCGFSMKHDQFGNALIYISLQNCFSQNVVTRLKFSIFIQSELHQVVETCQYNAWASREVICDYNYMEKQPVDLGFRATTVVFFTPEGEKPMSVADAQRRGYGIRNTPTRLVLRSPMMAPETYMQVFKTSTIFEKKWLATQVDAAAACPIQEGSVFLTQKTITWYLPRQMDPMISSGQFKLLEVHFGINGQRLNPLELQARGYSVALNDFYVITELPIGGVGGYYKSHIQDDKYYVSYMIEPMLELLWTEDATNEQTRYKVLFHIATHLLVSLLPSAETVPGEMTFKMVLGHFAVDVALINITFPAEVLSMADCSVRGFNILEHMSPNSSMKVFTLEVPFSDPAVLKQVKILHGLMYYGVTIFSLHLTFGLMLMDELEFFSYNAHLEAVVQNIVPPSVSGGCDKENFYVLVKYGSRGYNFQTLVGKRLMTPSLAQHYDYMENGTHFSFVVPFSSPDVAVEAIQSSFIKGRLDVILNNPETNSEIQEFSVACNFLSTLTVNLFILECFPNGTMTALALKLESVPSLNPSKLTLEDPSCGPVFSNDRYAFFVFTVNSCGTKRKVYFPPLNFFIYIFFLIPRRSEPYAENSKGQLQVVMRLAMDESYSKFQSTEDYPIAKYLQQPLYFEVELLKSTNPLVSLELENCWATKGERTSQPRWNLIINGCPNPVDPYQVVFHPVWADARVRYPSHFKRFEVKMFAFLLDLNLVLQIFVHCDVVICDAKNPLGGVCGKQCSKTKEMIRGEFEIEVQLGGGRGMLYYCALSSLDCINLNLLLFCWQVKNVTFLRSWILNMYQLDQYA
uniref:Zona pellucida protein AX 2 n=1 Tax=Cyprinodon variegatus TaxID=28743 RepID=A0A3Q2DLN7_CYPVA